MKGEKILEDEMLDEEQLDNVVGGTRAETRQLDVFLNKVLNKMDFSALDVNNADDMIFARDDLQYELGKFGITAKLDIGVDGTGVGEQSNKYYYQGVELSHNDIMKIMKKAELSSRAQKFRTMY